jgi:hypothetical protein
MSRNFDFFVDDAQPISAEHSSSSLTSSENGPMLKNRRLWRRAFSFESVDHVQEFTRHYFTLIFNFYFILIYFILSEIFSIVIPYSTLFVLYFNTVYCIIQSDAGDGIGFEAIDSFFLLIVATSAVPSVSSAPFVVSDSAF